MREDLKRKLDESVPEDVTLSDAKKRQIMMAARNRENGRKPSRVPKMLPALAGVAVIGLGGVLGYPYVSDWEAGRGAVEELPEPKKLVVAGHDYPVLIESEYDDQSENLLYNDGANVYSFDLAAGEESVLTSLEEKVSTYQFAVDGNWLAWEEYGEEIANLKIMNRETEEVETIEEANIIDLHIDEDSLVYARFGVEDDKPKYLSVNLNTMESQTVHKMTGRGSNSAASVSEGKLVIPEGALDGEKIVSEFHLYNLKENILIETFTLPYQSASGVTLNDGRIYGHFSNEETSESLLGYVDIETGEFTEIPTPDFVEFAVYGDYLALSIADEADSSDLHLYRMAGTELEEVPAFSAIDERLVRPRFTDDGTLVVNGEGEDLAMYLLELGTKE
ncbi:hypothetical protein [Planococcus halotolerans]|uniref:Uncharacterized protein n=1 Tax=Planococcus halotolerans TaxID=2233542 RepID=A0A365KQU3_9BACL|nr:hypothetical protein [Planococcus halotolerans]QHJ69594.1 hypothetical protein DNR44_002650 [Planococcus halotolerans]RAZ75543.1 hypothetical protein DP120_14360 [Planococcus halotolerans]